MTKENIDYKSIAEDLIWRNASNKETKNKGSMYYMIDVDYIGGAYPLGSIHYALNYRSNIHPTMDHELTWKELCIALKSKGYELLIPDDHDCSICSNRETCNAIFKDDPEQERCSGWKAN